MRPNPLFTKKELFMAARLAWLTMSSLLLLSSFAAQADTAVQVIGIKLQDSTVDSAIAHMRIVLDRDTVKPGRVTLQAVNESKSLTHEVLVIRDTGKPLPMDSKQSRVVEKRIHSLGEISELAPGKRGELTLNLKPGTYLLFCNQPAHFQDGMQAKLTVAP
jgi:uncharacterized cupredoxin-like copper-binding protein